MTQAADPSATAMPRPALSHKILPRHLARAAVVYVRQSTMQQIYRHQESTRIQYGLVEMAERYGWRTDQVQVIDDDLGISAASSEGREGFQRLLSDVALDRVGLILGVEMSRLARSCKDWYQLLELCAVFGTLIGDLDGLYDPVQYNDRLLLGLKGTMSEAELHVLKQRLEQGRLAKARRGELGRIVPVGYLRLASGEVLLDPDEQARAVVRCVFEQFERTGSISGVLRHLRRHDIRFGVRAHSGPCKGELHWSRPSRPTLSQMLHNPIYAGVYAYGRRMTDPRRRRPGRRGTGRLVVDSDKWLVCLKDRLPAYISWEQYEKNVAQLRAHRNSFQARGAPRKGNALLQGLVYCGQCGARMYTVHTKSGTSRYQCRREEMTYGGPKCQAFPAKVVDAEVSRLALAALAPSALEVSLRVSEDIERARAELEAQWRQRLERVRYEAERAARQYNVVEPENRLVARTLETAWEDKLREHDRLKEEYERSCREQPRQLTAAERESIRALAADLPALWKARSTRIEDRKLILRQIVERVVVKVEGTTEWMEIMIHWVGGQKTYRRLRRPVHRTGQLSGYTDFVARLRALVDENLNTVEIAKRLNREGWRRPHAGDRFTGRTVWNLLSSTGVDPRSQRDDGSVLGPGEWWLSELAREARCSTSAIHKRLRKGTLRGRHSTNPLGRWIVSAGPEDVAALRRNAARRRRSRKRRSQKHLHPSTKP